MPPKTKPKDTVGNAVKQTASASKTRQKGTATKPENTQPAVKRQKVKDVQGLSRYATAPLTSGSGYASYTTAPVQQGTTKKVSFTDLTNDNDKRLPRLSPQNSTFALRAAAPSRDPLPVEVQKERYCAFCYEHHGTRVHHRIPDQEDVDILRAKKESLERRLNDAHSEAQEDDAQFEEEGHTNLAKDAAILTWQIQRAEELRKKGFGAIFDLWIDHLTFEQLIAGDYERSAAFCKLPDDWTKALEEGIELKPRRRFPPGTKQRRDILREAAPGKEDLEETYMDNLDHQSVADDYRMRHGVPVIGLDRGDETDVESVEDSDEENVFDDDVGENLSHTRALQGLNTMKRGKGGREGKIPQVVRQWRDFATPPTHLESNLQLNDYQKDVHKLIEDGTEHNMSMEAYRATTNIAFSMQAAYRAWHQRALSDQGYTKLISDGFVQLGQLRDRLEAAGAHGLPPLHNLQPAPKIREKVPPKPFVIEHWITGKEAAIYRYTANRPLGPMITENAYTAVNEDELDNLIRAGFAGRSKKDRKPSKIRKTREEIMGMNMEMDQLVESD